MAEYPECPICSDIFGVSSEHIKAPKILSCGDSICKECLEQILNSSEEEFFLCPTCKEEIAKKENADKYTTNKGLTKMINESFNLAKNNEEERGDSISTSFDIISLGNIYVGKTSIFQRLSKDVFSDNYKSTIGCDTFIYYIKYKNKKYVLNLKDPPGFEKYKSLTRSFLRNADGVLFIYDITNRESFNDLESWYNIYKEENGEVVGLVIGNKCDCERKVSEEEAKKFSEEHGLKYLETSAKLDKKVKKAIACLLEEIIQAKLKNQDFTTIKDTISLHPSKSEKKTCKC